MRENKLKGLIKGTHQFKAKAMLTNDSFVQFYTGLHNAVILNALYKFVAPKVNLCAVEIDSFPRADAD